MPHSLSGVSCSALKLFENCVDLTLKKKEFKKPCEKSILVANFMRDRKRQRKT